MDEYSLNNLEAVPVLLQLSDVVLRLAVTKRLLQGAEFPLQGCSSLLQRPSRPGKLTVQLPETCLTTNQAILHLLLRCGTQVVEMADF